LGTKTSRAGMNILSFAQETDTFKATQFRET
jgi:hypothetical protein